MKANRRSGAASAGASEALGRRPARGRLATVRADFFLDSGERLSERERALMSAMLHCLIAEIAERLRAELPGQGRGGDDHELVGALNRAGLLDEPELIALLLRRAEEERIASAASARAGRSEARVLQGLVGNDSGPVSAAAMALILARGRRRDRFGQCLLSFDDLPARTAATLVHRVAAAIKSDGSSTDRHLVESATKLIGAHDPEKSVETLADVLAASLAEAGALDNDLLLAAAHEGDVSLLAHLLANSAAVPGAVAEAELLSGDPSAVVVVLRMAKVARPVAASILAAIGDLLRVHDPAAALSEFASFKDPAAEEAHVLVTSDPAYRAALALLEPNDG
ncbi:MAG: DUF2336 domain-containing protein [Sphingomicrobium sp.]